MPVELHPGLAITIDLHDVECVERLGVFPGIDLDLEGLDSELGQRDPFAPTNRGERVRFLHSLRGYNGSL